MLSNKLTFSLIFVLALALIAGPVLAQQLTSTGLAGDALNNTAAGQFLVVANSSTGNGITGVTPIAPTSPAALTNLEELLTLGGTIELVVEIAETGSVRSGANTTDNTADDFNSDYVYPVNLNNAELSDWVENNLKGDFVITEIMWGLDRTGADVATQDNVQWIEIYNNTAAVAASATTNPAALISGQGAFLVATSNQRVVRSVIVDAVASTTAGDIDGEDGTTNARVYAVVDRVSTIDFRGAHWAPKGQSGRTTVGTIAGQDASPIISMYRKADLTAAGAYNNTDKFRQVAAGAAGNRSGDGTDPASWEATPEDRRLNMTGRYYVGTPGHPHLRVGDVQDYPKAAVGAADDSGRGVIINEFRNDTSAANEDWVELINNEADGSTPISVNGWRLWLITAPDEPGGEPNGQVIAILPNYRIAPGAYLLIVNQDPESSSLAAGRNINEEQQGTVIHSGAEHVYFVSDFTLPNDAQSSGRYLLVLRRGGQTNYHENFEDFAGNGFFEFDGAGTEIYPMRGWRLPPEDGNIDPMFRSNTSLMGNVSYGRPYNPPGDPSARNDANSRGQRLHQDDWVSYGSQGGIGYDADSEMGVGTPGYANFVPNLVIDDRRDNDSDNDRDFDGTVTISEIMYDAGDRDNLAQWIELYNASTTNGIDIGGWDLVIHNKNEHAGDDQYVDHVLELDAVTIPPNRTLLLVSRPVNNRSRSLDADDARVYNLYDRHSAELGLNLLNSRLLSPHGFYLELKAPSEMSQGLELQNPAPDYTMDMAGNLKTNQKGELMIGDDDLPIAEWELSDIKNYKSDEGRKSIVRLYGGLFGGEGYAFNGSNAADVGTAVESWRGSSGHRHSPEKIFYGAPDDISTPGFRYGGPLPVSLSSFRPVRDQATGEVVVRWITQSELNNAGFNILRSETKNGEFKVVNIKGIVPGHGTTSEKHVYEWKDTSAKPNVVYYYQIEDVSLNGERTTLTTTRLKGHVSAAGKLTTTWSRLKQRD